MSGIARERCCCGATFEINAYLASSVEKGIQQFRDTHAACRAAWAERHNKPPNDSDRPRWLMHEARHQRERADRLESMHRQLWRVADTARVAVRQPNEPDVWLNTLTGALDVLNEMEAA